MTDVYVLQLDEAGSPVLLNGEAINDNIGSIVLSQLNTLGVLSAEAQFLKVPITSLDKWRESRHMIICAVDAGSQTLLGYLKYGYKDLFFYNRRGVVRQIEHCLCLLDFFVVSELQRTGLGKLLFREFLSCEDVEPVNIAYDRPSPKLLSFLRKHYQLCNPDAQPNKYTIYPGFPLDSAR